MYWRRCDYLKPFPGASDLKRHVELAAESMVKAQDESSPNAAFEELGYSCVFRGQKSYNGVALAARYPLAEKCTACYIDVEPRLGNRPSDHTPIVAEFDLV